MTEQAARPFPMPVLRQWQQAKARVPDGVVLFRHGDFYEAYYGDADILTSTLGLRKTVRAMVPLAGFPADCLTTYCRHLVAAGYKVAVCEPRAGRTLTGTEGET